MPLPSTIETSGGGERRTVGGVGGPVTAICAWRQHRRPSPTTPFTPFETNKSAGFNKTKKLLALLWVGHNEQRDLQRYSRNRTQSQRGDCFYLLREKKLQRPVTETTTYSSCRTTPHPVDCSTYTLAESVPSSSDALVSTHERDLGGPKQTLIKTRPLSAAARPEIKRSEP